MIVPDLLKTQSESHPRSHQSARQNSEIRSQTHQSTVLRSLRVVGSSTGAASAGAAAIAVAKAMTVERRFMVENSVSIRLRSACEALYIACDIIVKHWKLHSSYALTSPEI